VLQKIAASDIWIVLDDVQFAKREWQNRASIVPDHGKRQPHWLTLPVHLPNGQATSIADVELMDADNSLTAARATLANAFRHSPGWDRLQGPVQAALASGNTSLTDVCVRSTLALLECAGTVPVVRYASDLALPAGDPSDRIAALTELVGGTEYLCDSGGANYLRQDGFDRRDIAVSWQYWQEPMPAFADCTPARNISALNLAMRDLDRFVALTRHGSWNSDRTIYEAVPA